MDIHSTFETLAEAWVAASTPTAVNPEPKPTKTQSGTASPADQPSMLPKEQQQQQQHPHQQPGDKNAPDNSNTNTPNSASTIAISDSSNDNSDTHLHHHQHHHHHHHSLSHHPRHDERGDLSSPTQQPSSAPPPSQQSSQHQHHHHQATASVFRSPSPGFGSRNPPMTLNPILTTLTPISSGGRSVTSGLKAPSPRKTDISQTGIASMPIRCVVEHVNGAVSFDNTSSAGCDVTAVEQDAFAILPVSTPLCNLVRTALARLGYSATDAVNAKGAIQLKNWKPLSFDVITDDKEATIDEILRELKEYTLRIRLSSLPRLSSVEEMKEKLLQLLLTTSLSLLMDNGCPVEKNLLMSLSKGENFNVAEDMVAKFDSWYSSQISRNMKSPPSSNSSVTQPTITTTISTTTTSNNNTNNTSNNNNNNESNSSSDSKTSSPVIKREQSDTNSTSTTASSATPITTTTTTAPTKTPSLIPPVSSSSSSSSTAPPLLSSLSVPNSSQVSGQQAMNNGAGHFPPHNAPTTQLHGHNPILTPSKTRIRTSFDPEHEIPRLQRWFQENQHPSREQMVRFMSELNNLDSRRGRRPLDLTNIIYWFKNARAAQRRLSKALDDSFENEENVDVNGGGGGGANPPSSSSSAASANQNVSEPPAIPPYLPNKNAVYIVPYPYHTAHPSPSHTIMGTPEPTGDSNDEPCDLSIKKLKDTTSNQQEWGKSASGGGREQPLADGCVMDGRDCGRNSVGHKRGSPVSNGFSGKKLCREEGGDYKSPSFNGLVAGKCAVVSGGKDQRSNGELGLLEDVKLLEKHYHSLKEDREQRLVMDLREEGDASSDESMASDMENGGLKIQEDEMDYVRARAELSMGMSRLASTSESSAASIAALSLAQMSQPTLQIPMSPLNPLAMYYNLPPYYHPSPSHHSQSSVAATAAMVAAFSGSGHINGHSNGHTTHSSANAPNPQSPAGGRPVSIQPSPHPPLSASQAHSRSSEPRKRRTRVFIDPLTEIPKLEKWFLEDTHPSAYMIDKYTETLNSAEYRQKFPKLEPKNIQLWFKNHRAKVKRQRMGLGGEEGGVCDSPPPSHGSRSTTPLPLPSMVGSSGSASGALSSPDTAGSSKHSDDVHNGHGGEEGEEEDMEEGEQ